MAVTFRVMYLCTSPILCVYPRVHTQLVCWNFCITNFIYPFAKTKFTNTLSQAQDFSIENQNITKMTCSHQSQDRQHLLRVLPLHELLTMHEEGDKHLNDKANITKNSSTSTLEDGCSQIFYLKEVLTELKITFFPQEDYAKYSLKMSLAREYLM